MFFLHSSNIHQNFSCARINSHSTKNRQLKPFKHRIDVFVILNAKFLVLSPFFVLVSLCLSSLSLIPFFLLFLFFCTHKKHQNHHHKKVGNARAHAWNIVFLVIRIFISILQKIPREISW